MPALAVALIAGLRLGRGVDLHVDEPSWIASSYYFELAASGDWRNPDWRLLPAIESPPVGKYLFGLALRLAGRPVRSIEPLASTYERYRPIPGAWGTGEAAERRRAIADRLAPEAHAAVAVGAYRPFAPEQLAACRAVVVLFGMIAAGAIAGLGNRLGGPLAGLTAGLLFAAHPLVIKACSLALFDIMALAFSALALLALIRTNESLGWKRWAWALALGLLVALAVGTKMNALIVVPVVVFGLLRGRFAGPAGDNAGQRGAGDANGAVSPGEKGSRKPARGGGLVALALVAVTGLAAFLALDPTLYADPLAGVADLFRIPAETTRVQAGFLPDHLATWKDKLTTVGDLLCGHPLGLLVVPVVVIPALTGSIRSWSPRSVVVLWSVVALGAVVAWIPFPWPRYVLPAVPPLALLVADLVAGLVRCVQGRQAL